MKRELQRAAALFITGALIFSAITLIVVFTVMFYDYLYILGIILACIFFGAVAKNFIIANELTDETPIKYIWKWMK